MSASPPRVSLSYLIFPGRKEELSMKKSFLIESLEGGIKTPKSYKAQKKSGSKDTPIVGYISHPANQMNPHQPVIN